ncbi:hypothetical protein EVAR_327_1 [Eumeta japonica]|uniref:Uncharacterized protein n=1 Tax=Eumeta variegata TaxID=151549 RepID=A0A4C1S9T7_EUMVA|nr:hypothetical protein EVAR_327_1 [Eumeta japonica]
MVVGNGYNEKKRSDWRRIRVNDLDIEIRPKAEITVILPPVVNRVGKTAILDVPPLHRFLFERHNASDVERAAV